MVMQLVAIAQGVLASALQAKHKRTLSVRYLGMSRGHIGTLQTRVCGGGDMHATQGSKCSNLQLKGVLCPSLGLQAIIK